MTKGRTTTYDERVEIVRFCDEPINTIMPRQLINSGILSASVFAGQISNSIWCGCTSGQTRKRKSEDEMSEVEKLRAQNKLLPG
ncbi:hypothetical protein P7H17_23505 [Paenibacillus larvae]|nr:hypothetical protein [Paenibacillus larvae]MDT2288414.1 hypothetical protein [Paenibacillus larvae]